MSLTITKQPIGHKLNNTDVDALVIDDGQGNALVYTTSAHGLSDGDYVYIESDLEAYNGFKYVDSIQYDSFKIKDSANGDYAAYQQDADITYRTSVLNHGWQCVHLPIVYEIESDLWPNNVDEEAYTPNVIDSFENQNGYVQLNLDRAITGATALNYIELVGDGDLAGPYQIISVEHAWALVIDLAYDSTYDFSGYQVVDYYNNYNINVEVWAGLQTTNRWYAKKPFELAATLKFIPDSEGKAFFSIHEILRGYIETRNNLLLNTLPNNLDFHVAFYIKCYESYDQSDGELISTTTGSVTTDTFEGRAVNSMLPFKTLYSGHMSDYLNEGSELARWLTVFDRPMAVVDRFFDISFLNQYDGLDILILRNGEAFQTITNPGSGVIRVMFIPETGFSEYCLQAYISGSDQMSLAGFVSDGGTGEAWTTGVNPAVNLNFPVTDNSTEVLYADYTFIEGATYTITVFTTVAGSGNLAIRVMDDSLNVLDSGTSSLVGGGNKSFSFTSPAGATKIGFRATGTSLSLSLSNLTIDVENTAITEQICIDIIEECYGTFVNDELRSLENTRLREVD